MSAEQNKAVVRRLLEEVWARGKTELLPDLVSADVRDENPLPGQPCGLEGQRWATETIRGAFSNMTMKIDELIADGDYVMDRWTGTGKHTGSFMGMPPSGRTFNITGSDLLRMRGGKIVQTWHVEDNLGMLQQLGFAPAAGLPASFGRRTAAGGTASDNPARTGVKQLSDRDRKDLVREGYRTLLDRGDLNRIPEFLHPDFVGHYSAFPPVYGHDGFRQFLSIYTSGLSDRRTDFHEILVDGDRVACRLKFHGKNTGPMMGMPATGKETDTDGLTILRFAGDRVIEQWANNDDLAMMQQLGVIPIEAGLAQPEPC